MPPDIFHRAAETLERESRLLNRDYDRLHDTEPLPPLASLPDTRLDLHLANESADPRRLKPGVRAAFLKRLLQRILTVYTNGQVAFNASAIRVVNALDARLRLLHSDLAEFAAVLERRITTRVELTEERRALWEGRFAGRTQDIEERVSALEADLSEALAQRNADRRRIEELERTIVTRLEGTDTPPGLGRE